MSTEEITKLIDDYAERIMGPRSEQARSALQSAIEALEVENLGLRLECQGLKAEVAEYKSYWKEATRKNRSLLEENADLALLADQYKAERDQLQSKLDAAPRIGGQP